MRYSLAFFSTCASLVFMISCSPSTSESTAVDVVPQEDSITIPDQEEEVVMHNEMKLDTAVEAVEDEIPTATEPEEIDTLRRKVLDRLLQEKTMNRGLDTSK